MFFHLLLAHFIADYPLQTSWLVKAKHRLPGLSLHVGIHLLVLCLLSGAAWPVVWPYMLLLAAIHFCIDFTKSRVSRSCPDLIIGPYLADQVLHISSIIFTAWLISRATDVTALLPIHTDIALYGTGYLLVSYVWFITERILVHQHPDYQEEINQQFWPRMGVRLALLTLLLMLPQSLLAGVMVLPLAGMVVRTPYPSTPYRLYAITNDIAVAVSIWLLLHAASHTLV